MKIILKITAVMNIIFGLHYIALGIIAIFVGSFAGFVSIATLSLKLIGGTIGIILCIALYLALAYLYGYGGICVLKNNKRTALINSMIATAISLLMLIISLISKKIPTSFLDVVSVILPAAQAFLLIQTEE